MKDKITKALEKITGKIVHLEFPSQEDFGDYSTNIALQSKNPGEEAKKIVEKLEKEVQLEGVVSKIEIKGPGFINFWLSKDYLLSNMSLILDQKERYGTSDKGKGKVVIVDYSSPNIAKRFSIGHLRSTVIGQALYNLYKDLGYKVIGDNHLGDWGTQFGSLIYMVEIKELNPDSLKIENWEELYVEFHKKLEKEPELKEKAKEAFKRLEEGDKKARLIWQSALETSLKEYQKIYDLLGINFDYSYGESFYEDKIPLVLKEIEKERLAEKGEKGALIMPLDDLPPGMLVKSDGATTYFIRDLATLKFRKDTWHPDIFIYEVGSDQTLYFRQVFKGAQKLGWIKDQKLVHVSHGLVRFDTGKMSTRQGQTIKLEEVLSKAIEKAGEFNKEKNIAQIVGIGAIKYFDLMHSPSSDIIFDWNKIFVLEGKSGPYLQYTAVRIKSLLNKALKIKKFNNSCEDILYEEERAVLRVLMKFPEVLETSAFNFTPNLLANYLFELSQKFNAFYNKHQVIGSQKEEFRINLSKAVLIVLEKGLLLLGIEVPLRM